MSKMLTPDSTVRELYATPVGHDVLAKVLMQLGIAEGLLTNPVVGNLKLKWIFSLAKKQINPSFLDTLLALVNSEKDVPADRIPGAVPETVRPAWWKEAVFYQVYPRSFADANGDGIGDLKGILGKLDYLKNLGVNAIWLSPIYDSPNDDNGYDIRDYRKIMTEFGTMADFDALLAGVHERGMKLIMDLVVNHTSDEHAWFEQALADPSSKYRDYYFLREGEVAPNNWTSFFSGTAWNHYEEQGLWGLHLFSKKQMDLNWDNPEVRRDVIDMINWWLDKGVDGFRMDVINYISKAEGLPQGDPSIGEMMGFAGIEHYYYGPHLHEYLKQIHDEAFAPHEAFSVGETPGIGMEMGKLLTGEERGELNMIFSFDQLETPGHIRGDDYVYDLNYYRDYICDWMLHYGNNCWMSLFYNNHDNPRMANKVTRDPALIKDVQKLLAVMQFTLKGTPFIFQGDEMGLTNYDFRSMEELSDVEAVNYFAEHRGEVSDEELFAHIRRGTRDHARVLLPWNESAKALPEHLQQEADGQMRKLYQSLIRMRRNHRALIYGEFVLEDGSKDSFVYRRRDENEEFVIECNLAGRKKRTKYKREDGMHLVYPKRVKPGQMEPYEVRIWHKNLK
ncbi:MAG: alpha-glucosidase [Lachnospiraceae bacterium]|nr:alpha-glucosidase [Lachnospiraceae bacterium]